MVYDEAHGRVDSLRQLVTLSQGVPFCINCQIFSVKFCNSSEKRRIQFVVSDVAIAVGASASHTDLFLWPVESKFPFRVFL